MFVETVIDSLSEVLQSHDSMPFEDSIEFIQGTPLQEQGLVPREISEIDAEASRAKSQTNVRKYYVCVL
jgi:hypothetical protein